MRLSAILPAALLFASAAGCANNPQHGAGFQGNAASILTQTSPASGSVHQGPVDTLRLHFDPPARLAELIVEGPSGKVASMVHAVGEVADYQVPIDAGAPGSYTVHWRALVGQSAHSGTFAFSIR